MNNELSGENAIFAGLPFPEKNRKGAQQVPKALSSNMP